MPTCGDDKLNVTEVYKDQSSTLVFDSYPHFCGRPIYMTNGKRGLLTYDLTQKYIINLSNHAQRVKFYLWFSSSRLIFTSTPTLSKT